MPRPATVRDAPLTLLFYSDAPYEGGAERYIDYLVGAHDEAGRVGVVLGADAELDALAARLSDRGARVFRCAREGPGALRGLWRAVRSMNPDVVHINLPFSYAAQLTFPALIARLAGARAIVTTEHLTMFPPMRLRGRLRTLLTRLFVDRVITLTESNREDLTSAHGMPAGKIRVVPNGVADVPHLAPGEAADLRASLEVPSDRVLLLHVAALTERKGHGFLLDALERVGETPWHLVLVGDGEERDALETRVVHAGLEGRVTFAGWRKDATRIIAAADVLLLPSRVEGMPLTLLEALACGRPAIATKIFGVPEIYGDREAAALVAYGDVEALADALRSLIEDGALRRAMGAEARALYEARYTVERLATATDAVYREALGGRT